MDARPNLSFDDLNTALKAAGVPVMVASDNTRDPFYAYGDLDMIEVMREATRILHLGAQHFDGTAEEYRRSPLYRRLMGGESHA